jgi:23S rRNA (cytosine1962-C5)-methyltransferase
MKTLYLKKNEDRRIRSGHAWIFSNEVDAKRSPMNSFEPGEQARVVSESGGFLGNAYINPGSLICARVYTRDPAERLDSRLLRLRIAEALRVRQSVFEAPYYRLVYSESDLLPGLIVDRFGDILTVQSTTAGMERVRQLVAESLEELLKPAGILWKNDSAVRELENLPRFVESTGDVPDVASVIEDGATLRFPLREGQKTGWYYDQRPNRLSFARYCKDRDVLDLFSYVGATGVAALRAGARSVTCVDGSGPAIEFARANMETQNSGAGLELLTMDGFDALKSLERGRFSAIMLDPPAFIKRRKDIKTGLEAYLRLNTLAMSLLGRQGVLATCSCSQHLSLADLTDIVRRAGLKASRSVRILETGHQGPDHPVHPAIPETAYLKGLVCWVE